MEWLENLSKVRRLSEHTVKAYQADVLNFFRFLSEYKGDEVSFKMLEETSLHDYRSWLANRYKQSVSRRSAAREISALKNFLHFLKERDHITSNSISLLKTPKLSKTLPKPLPEAEAKKFLEEVSSISDTDWIGLRDKALFTLIYSCGLRISEALRLTYKDIKDQQQIQILGKGRKQRIVPLLPVVYQAIMNYVAVCPYQISAESILFVGAKGGALSPTVAQKQMRAYRHLVGLPEFATPHALRHSCATHLMASSHNIRAVQDLLGHESLSTTQLYTELQTEQLLDVYDKAHPRSKALDQKKEQGAK